MIEQAMHDGGYFRLGEIRKIVVFMDDYVGRAPSFEVMEYQTYNCLGLAVAIYGAQCVSQIYDGLFHRIILWEWVFEIRVEK